MARKDPSIRVKPELVRLAQVYAGHLEQTTRQMLSGFLVERLGYMELTVHGLDDPLAYWQEPQARVFPDYLSRPGVSPKSRLYYKDVGSSAILNEISSLVQRPPIEIAGIAILGGMALSMEGTGFVPPPGNYYKNND